MTIPMTVFLLHFQPTAFRTRGWCTWMVLTTARLTPPQRKVRLVTILGMNRGAFRTRRTTPPSTAMPTPLIGCLWMLQIVTRGQLGCQSRPAKWSRAEQPHIGDSNEIRTFTDVAARAALRLWDVCFIDILCSAYSVEHKHAPAESNLASIRCLVWA